MPIYRKNGKSVLFIHIPKAAGTTIDHGFLRAGWTVGLQDGGGRPDTILPHLLCSFQHFHAALLSSMLRLGSFDAIFAVMRDPMTRLESEYRWRRKHSKAPLPDFERWTIQQFDDFGRNPFILGNHIRPQAEFLLPQAQVFAIEQGIAPIFAALSRTLGETIPVDAGAVENASDSDALPLSKSARARVEAFYAKDFRLHARLLENGPTPGQLLVTGTAASAAGAARRIGRRLLRR